MQKDKMTNMESLLSEIVKMHPGKATILKVSKEDEKRAWEAWKKSEKEVVGPLRERARQDRLRGFEKARNFIVR